MAGTLEYELLNKNLEMVDGHAVKAPEDYQNPEQLYEALIARVRNCLLYTSIDQLMDMTGTGFMKMMQKIIINTINHS